MAYQRRYTKSSSRPRRRTSYKRRAPARRKSSRSAQQTVRIVLETNGSSSGPMNPMVGPERPRRNRY